jgi:hypothetical protein
LENEARDRKRPLKVVVSTRERQEIEARAKAAGLSVSAYLRSVGLGHEPKNLFDREAILTLIRLHADQGRLGGLLKLWLSDKKGQGTPSSNVRSVLQQIEGLQMQLAKLVMQEAVKTR